YRIHHLDTETNRSPVAGEAQAQAPGPIDLGTFRIGDRAFHEGGAKVGEPAPELPEATTHYGAPIKLNEFRGKFILLHFGGAWSMIPEPGVQEVYDSFRDDDRLVILNHFIWD